MDIVEVFLREKGFMAGNMRLRDALKMWCKSSGKRYINEPVHYKQVRDRCKKIPIVRHNVTPTPLDDVPIELMNEVNEIDVNVSPPEEPAEESKGEEAVDGVVGNDASSVFDTDDFTPNTNASPVDTKSFSDSTSDYDTGIKKKSNKIKKRRK
jgi:hypothetical protein